MKGSFFMKPNTKIVVYVGLLSAIATVLMFFPHFPILGAFPFLKIDFADVPAIFASVTINPLAGILVEFIKNLIHMLSSDTAFVGELSNFIVGSAFSVSCGVLARYTFKNTLMKKKLIPVLSLSVLIQVVCAVISNYFVVAPLYFGDNSEKIVEFVIYGTIPFNIIKSALQAVIFYLLYRGIYPYIQKNMYIFK